jgi:hypothetical protein
MRRLLTVFMAGFFLLATAREGRAAPIELVADLEVAIGSNGITLCEQSVANAVVNPAVSVACSTGTIFPGAFVQAFANPDGSISLGGQFSATSFTSISVGAEVKMKGDLIHVQSNTLTSGWLQLVGHPSGAVTFSTLDCELGCTALANIEGRVDIGGLEEDLVQGSYLGGVPGLVTVFPQVTGAFMVPFTVGVQMPIEYSFEVDASIIGGTWPIGLSLLGSFALADPPLITILDSNLQPVPDAQLISAAGIDYGAGAIQPVPEPSVLALLAAGIAGAAQRRVQLRETIRTKENGRRVVLD